MNNYIKKIGFSMAGIALPFVIDTIPVHAEAQPQSNIQVQEQLTQSDSPKIQKRLRDMKRNPDGSPIKPNNETQPVNRQEIIKPFRKFDRFVEYRTVGRVVEFRIINNPSPENEAIAVKRITAAVNKKTPNSIVKRVD